MTTTTDHDITDILLAIDDDTALNDTSNAFWTYLEEHVAPVHRQEAIDRFSRYERQVEEKSVKVTLRWVEENDDQPVA